jgi:hypothetical protein
MEMIKYKDYDTCIKGYKIRLPIDPELEYLDRVIKVLRELKEEQERQEQAEKDNG